MEHDCPNCVILRAEVEALRNYKARVGLRHEGCDAKIRRLRAALLHTSEAKESRHGPSALKREG